MDASVWWGGTRDPENLQPVVVPRDHDEWTIVRTPNGPNVPHWAVEHETTRREVERLESTTTRTAEHDAIAGVIPAEHRRNAELVSRQQEVHAAVAVEVLRQGSVNSGELRFCRKGPDCECAIAIVQRD